jgi:hypothetical protein
MRQWPHDHVTAGTTGVDGVGAWQESGWGLGLGRPGVSSWGLLGGCTQGSKCRVGLAVGCLCANQDWEQVGAWAQNGVILQNCFISMDRIFLYIQQFSYYFKFGFLNYFQNYLFKGEMMRGKR